MDEHAQTQEPIPPGMCPTGCGRKQPAGKLMCLTCWREVPKHLQDQVNTTWRNYRSAVRQHARRLTTETAAIKRGARSAYESARDAAIGSIR